MFEDCRSVASWTDPGAPTQAYNKRLFAPMNSMLVTESRFLKLK